MTPAKRTNNRRRIVEAKYRPTLEKPDWNAWRKIKNAPLWELVALSCDIDPQSLRGWTDAKARPTVPKNFISRLRFAESILSIHGGGLTCTPEDTHSFNARIELGDFRAWMEYEGCDFPENFPRHTSKKPPKETSKERQLRLTHRIAEVRTTRKDFMAHIASEEKISIARLQQIVGKSQEQKQRLMQVFK